MFQKLFEIPLLGDLPTSWPVFIVLVVALAGLITWGSKIRADGEEKEDDGDGLKQIKKKKRLVGQLLVVLPTAAFVTAFLTYVQTPFGNLPINSYGFAIMVGFLLACWIGVRRAKPLGIDSDFILDVGIIAMIAGIIGAKINYLLQYPADYAPPQGSDLKTLFGDMGLNPLGGLVLGPLPFAFWWWRTQADPKKVKLYSWQTAVLMFLTLLFALIGTRALYLYQNKGDYHWAMFENWQSGFVLYGGLIGGVAAGVLYVKMRGQSLARIADLTAPVIMLGVAFGRLGCFLNGCCFGNVCEGFPGISFPRGSPPHSTQLKADPPLIDHSAEQSLPVHPTQLYETVVCVGFFFLLSWMWKKKRKAEGEVFLVMVMLYGVWRFLVEFVRGDDRPQWLGELYYSQVVSLAAFIAAAIWLFLLRKRAAQAPAELPPSAPPPEAPAAEPKA